MTNEEVILYLKSTIDVQQIYRGNDAIGARYGSCYGHEDEISLAIEALEKQMPKKADTVPQDDEGCYLMFVCPACGKYLSYGYPNKPYEKPHHCRCGQAIDWE